MRKSARPIDPNGRTTTFDRSGKISDWHLNNRPDQGIRILKADRSSSYEPCALMMMRHRHGTGAIDDASAAQRIGFVGQRRIIEKNLEL